MNNNGYHSRRKAPDNGNEVPNNIHSLPVPIQQGKSRRRADEKVGMNKEENAQRNAEGLMPKQQRFVDEYMVDYNGTQAAIRAGYSARSAHVQCSGLLENPKIKAAIQARKDKLAAKFELDREGIIERYKCLMDYQISDFFNDDGTMKPISEIPKRSLYAIQGFKQNRKIASSGKGDNKIVVEDFIKEFNLPTKRAVLDSVVKLLGLIPEESNGGKFNFNGPVQINIGFED